MQVKLNDISIGSRIRKKPGDLNPLKGSMQRHGLLQPILIDQSYRLIAGYRRLKAAQSLGWDSIEALMITKNKRERRVIEVEENTTRLDFSPSELDKATRLLDLDRKGVFGRFVLWLLY